MAATGNHLTLHVALGCISEALLMISYSPSCKRCWLVRTEQPGTFCSLQIKLSFTRSPQNCCPAAFLCNVWPTEGKISIILTKCNWSCFHLYGAHAIILYDLENWRWCMQQFVFFRLLLSRIVVDFSYSLTVFFSAQTKCINFNGIELVTWLHTTHLLTCKCKLSISMTLLRYTFSVSIFGLENHLMSVKCS